MKEVVRIRSGAGNSAIVFKSKRLECYLVQWVNDQGDGVDGFPWEVNQEKTLKAAISHAEEKVGKAEGSPCSKGASSSGLQLGLEEYAELIRDGISVGAAQQATHMAKAACEALGLDYDDASPADITEAVRRLR